MTSICVCRLILFARIENIYGAKLNLKIKLSALINKALNPKRF